MIEPRTMTDLARMYSTIRPLNFKVRAISDDHYLEARLVMPLGSNINTVIPVLSEILLDVVRRLAVTSGEIDRFSHAEIRQQVHRLDRILNERAR